MRVLLLADVRAVGRSGEVAEVSDGYARNFLFPKHLAIPATPEAVRRAGADAAAVAAAAERELAELQRLAARMDGCAVTVSGSANEQGTLYGSIGDATIGMALRAAGFSVDDHWVDIEEPIRETGEHAVRLRLPHGLEVEITVIVEAEQ